MGKYNIYFALEGLEEEYLFKIIQEFGVHESFDISFDNCGGFGNVTPYYQDALTNELYDCSLCVYDVDYRHTDSDSPFNLIRKDLETVVGEGGVDAASICTNPNILQFYLLSQGKLNEVAMASTSKKENTKLVNKYWPEIGKKKTDAKGHIVNNDYDASKWQLEIMYYSFVNNPENYEKMLDNAKELPIDYQSSRPGSNLLQILAALRAGDKSFFENINKKIKKE